MSPLPAWWREHRCGKGHHFPVIDHGLTLESRNCVSAWPSGTTGPAMGTKSCGSCGKTWTYDALAGN